MGKLIELDNASFKINCRSDDRAEIIIYQDIGQASFFSDSLSAKEFNEELKKLKSSVKNIDIRINSMGGDVFEGITIYNRLKQHKAKRLFTLMEWQHR